MSCDLRLWGSVWITWQALDNNLREMSFVFVIDEKKIVVQNIKLNFFFFF